MWMMVMAVWMIAGRRTYKAYEITEVSEAKVYEFKDGRVIVFE